VVVSTESEGRDGLIVETRGIDLTAYRNNSVVLWQHNPDWPCARALTIGPQGSDLIALVQFPAEGRVERSDEVYNLISEKIINASSIGFNSEEAEQDPSGALRIRKSELVEFSFVSCSALRDSLIVDRSGHDPARRERQRMANKFRAERDAEMEQHRRLAAQLRSEIADEALLRRMKPATQAERRRLAELLQRERRAGR